MDNSLRFPPTSEDLRDDTTRPYFLWWTDATVADLKAHLAASDPEERAYWMGALLREANSRDVWLFTTAAEIRALWPRLIRYLGRSREMWAWLLELPRPQWPPPHAAEVTPLPDTFEPLASETLRDFRDDLAERMRKAVASETEPP